HLLTILEQFSPERGPLDGFLHAYFRSHKALGSKDRAYIGEMVYGLTRWGILVEALSAGERGWQERLAAYEKYSKLFDDALKHFPRLAPHVALSFPQELYDALKASLGEEEANLFCLHSNRPAPTTLRANLLKCTRTELAEILKEEGISTEPTLRSPYGLKLEKRLPLFHLESFKKGLFEMQDEGSQLLADLVDASPKQHVLDFCSGSGGKTLAFAHKLRGTGQLYLHDIRLNALQEAKKRMKRAGIENVQFIPSGAGKLKKLKNRMDWTLVDAPCTGTGTLRRNPDMKMRFSLAELKKTAELQRSILSEAVKSVKPGGHLVYSTCSVLKEENEDQVAWIEEHLPLKLLSSPLKTSPAQEEMDGFFGAVFVKST
ncbi:MAG: RsmB/NOP family class I SAM-dependent RNA methyltransferase, partial [Chlamydiia bacterium]|nr:RsmB/NOP family class I SAM-dependent RNA methyltransferase [Chlamydiia bacterium]